MVIRMVRRSTGSGRSLTAIDGNLDKLREQLLALQARIDAADEERLDFVGRAALEAFPEIDEGEYGDDLEAFLKSMHEDALAYRKAKSQASEQRHRPVQPSQPSVAESE